MPPGRSKLQAVHLEKRGQSGVPWHCIHTSNTVCTVFTLSIQTLELFTILSIKLEQVQFST